MKTLILIDKIYYKIIHL